MTLDPEVGRRPMAWLDAKGAPHCSQCGGTVWSARERIVAIALGEPHADGTVVPLQECLPAYVVSCANCGYIVLLNTEIVGIPPGAQP